MDQPTVQYMYQGLQYANFGIPFAYHVAPLVVVPPHAYPRAPYALYGVQYAHTANLGTQMGNSGLMYSA